jgi:subtilase family serine protease
MRDGTFNRNLVRDLIGIAVLGASACSLRAAQDRVVLPGNTSPQAQPQFDRGPVPPSQVIQGIRLIARLAPARQAELNRFTAAQQDPASPDYHRWLTPQQYAQRFGWSAEDLARLRMWLESQGFKMIEVAPSRNAITFSGTAAQVQSAFDVALHRYAIGGETHFANSSDPSVPAALARLIQSIQGLNDFRLRPEARASGAGSNAARHPD